jgi:resuscitation-promoting factor RpfB
LPAHSYGLPLAHSVRPSPARARPADRGAWLPVPDVNELPELVDLLEPHCLVAPRSARTEGNVRPTPTRPRPTARPSPARARPHDAATWLPVPDVDLLPELEELLAPDKLVPEPVRPAPDVPPAPSPSVPPAEPVVARGAPAPLAPAPIVPAPPAPAPPAPAPARKAPPRRHLRPLSHPAPAPLELEPTIETQPAPRTARVTPAERHSARTRRRGRHALLLACVLIIVVALAGVLVPRLRDARPQVDLRVDGKRISVKSDARTVGSLLRHSGIEVRAADLVTPALGAKVTDGLDVKVLHAQTISIDHDGVRSKLKTTETRPSRVLGKLGLDEDNVALVDPPRRLDASKPLKIRTIHTATIVVDGANQALRTPALTVAEFLQQNGVVLGELDSVTPSRETPITDGLTVTVARISTEVETTIETNPAPIEKRDDPTLPVGQEKVIQDGSDGKTQVGYQLLRQDGEVVGKSPISMVPIEPAVPRIIAIGTMKPVSSGAGSRTGSASWYQSPFGDDSCATKEYIPKGTIITVTNLETGQSIPCRVADRVEADRVVDMDKEAFAQLKSPYLGVFPARVDW